MAKALTRPRPSRRSYCVARVTIMAQVTPKLEPTFRQVPITGQQISAHRRQSCNICDDSDKNRNWHIRCSNRLHIMKSATNVFVNWRLS